MATMMKCGHAATTQDSNGQPVCVICVGIDPGATEIVPEPDLTDRTARCAYYGSKCHSEKPSSLGLAFFEHLPQAEHDRFYCGCFGWD